MNHQPFETWLLSEEPLLPEQVRQLRDHLRECEACRRQEASWTGVHQLIQAAPLVQPAPGFAIRWQTRLANDTRRRHRRQSLAMFLFLAGMAALLLGAIAWQIIDLVRGPDQWLMAWAFRLSSAWYLAEASQDVLFTMARNFVTAVPLPVWMFGMGILSIICVLWAVAVQQFTFSRRFEA